MNIQKRHLLFLIGCIPTRLFGAYLAKTQKRYLPYIGYIAAAIGIGFLYLYFTGKRQTGVEVDSGRIWWNSLRPVHGFLHLYFAYCAINNSPNAWRIIVIDALIGLVSFLLYHSGIAFQ